MSHPRKPSRTAMSRVRTPSGRPRFRFFGSYHKERVARISVLLDGLAELGHSCEEMNAKLPLDHAQRLAMLMNPWRIVLLPFALLRAWTSLIIQRAKKSGADVIVVPYMGHFDVLLARALHPRTLIVLDHLISAADTANDRRAPPWQQKILRWLDYIALSTADMAMLDTEEQRALVPARLRHKTFIVPVGAPRSWYRKAPERTNNASLSIVFFGLFTPLQGTPTIARALNLLHERGIPFRATLIGRGQDYAETRTLLLNNPCIRWIDWLDNKELIDEVSGHEVCLGIFGTSAKAMRVVPQKLYLGAAAGCGLISSHTPPQVRAFGASAWFTAPGDPDNLATQLARLAAEPGALRTLRAKASGHAKNEYQPTAIAARLVDAIDQWRFR